MAKGAKVKMERPFFLTRKPYVAVAVVKAHKQSHRHKQTHTTVTGWMRFNGRVGGLAQTLAQPFVGGKEKERNGTEVCLSLCVQKASAEGASAVCGDAASVQCYGIADTKRGINQIKSNHCRWSDLLVEVVRWWS